MTTTYTSHNEVVETVGQKPKQQVESKHTFEIRYNPHSCQWEVFTQLMGRPRVQVCHHISELLAQQCVDGIGCAHGTPVGRYE